MRSLLFASLVFAGCATPSTPCGLERSGAPWLTDDALQTAERELLQRMPLTADERLHERNVMCGKLAGVEVVARGSGAWSAGTVEGVEEVDGLANCKLKRVELASPPEGVWQFGALAHELVHVLTDCDGHAGWSARGINQQLTNIYFTAVP